MSLSPQELEAMSRYTSPVNPAVFPHLTVVLLAIGMFFTAWFFVYPRAGGGRETGRGVRGEDGGVGGKWGARGPLPLAAVPTLTPGPQL